MDWLLFVFLLPIAIVSGLMAAAIVMILLCASMALLANLMEAKLGQKSRPLSGKPSIFPDFDVRVPMPKGTKEPQSPDARH